MVIDDQRDVIAFLSTPEAHGGAAVERVETHASVVFLAGPRALKLKRAVRYDYLDFSTVERRREMCEAEVRINRRLAPDLYRGVAGVARRADGTLSLDGPGTPVDWLVDMARFDQQQLFDRLADRGALDPDLMPPLAAAIARFHLAAERHVDHGGRAGMAWVIDGNADGFAEQGAGILDPEACAAVTRRARRALEEQDERLETRREAGFVRRCHGDLHLRNIVLLDGRPTLFDAVEFNDEIACTDVLYDVAFLLMDLWRRRLPAHANTLWNAYLAGTGDFGGLPLLPLFLSCRAAVRAKTSATAATLADDPRRRGHLQALAREYLEMAAVLLEPPPPCVIAIGGRSGSGKSTVARALAPSVGAVPGAVVIRSDVVRKRLRGAEPLAPLGPEGYAPQVSREVYATLADRAALVARGGQAAIADAVFARAEDRADIEAAAAAAHVPFVGLWLDAPEATLVERAEGRRADPSDAGAAVIRAQLAQETGTIGWHWIDAAADPGRVLQRALDVVRRAVAAGRESGREIIRLPG